MTDAIARSKRILALVDEYHEKPVADTRTALRIALMDELSTALGEVKIQHGEKLLKIN
ncbi:hypothetical protein R6242_21565 [Iodobacter sp. CM08]|uniref:hypothetical protein n=1 Tax=Iodobacter sp. CM08 TaxID=3085902 RepID=UPI0029827D56|nr:hypothetical protein [Iodobacter sp. CM08]MDW5419166.1 hypothetical protein [Iodobacter sp. CM08]